jgi:hypothetical protein
MIGFLFPVRPTFAQQSSSSPSARPEQRDAMRNPFTDPLWSTLSMLVNLDRQIPGFALRQLKGAGLDEEQAMNVVLYVQRALAENQTFERDMWRDLCRDRGEIKTSADLDPRLADMNARYWANLWEWIDDISRVTGLSSEESVRIVKAVPTTSSAASAGGESAAEDDRPVRTEAQIAASLARVCGAYGF